MTHAQEKYLNSHKKKLLESFIIITGLGGSTNPLYHITTNLKKHTHPSRTYVYHANLCFTIKKKMIDYRIRTSGISAFLILVPLGMFIYIILREQGEAILCMECQQCRAVCPVIPVDGEYIGPKDIMIAAKSGKYQEALKMKLELCTDCVACMERCPRGLDVSESNKLISSVEMMDILNRATIEYTQKIPNPKMQRSFEAVIRRFEGPKMKLPWEWVSKSFKLKTAHNVFGDKTPKPAIGNETVLDDGKKEIIEIKSLLFNEKPPEEKETTTAKTEEKETTTAKTEGEEKTTKGKGDRT